MSYKSKSTEFDLFAARKQMSEAFVILLTFFKKYSVWEKSRQKL